DGPAVHPPEGQTDRRLHHREVRMSRAALSPPRRRSEAEATMAIHLLRDLDNMQRDLVALAGLVEDAVHKATRALQTRAATLAREVIAGDPQIDLEENHLNEECLKLLALHQPVARDLRRITAAMMITTDLERMGDLAEEIAERALSLMHVPNL